MRKLLSMILALCLLASAFVACSGQPAQENEEENTSSATEKVTDTEETEGKTETLPTDNGGNEETEGREDPKEPDPEVNAALPEREADLSYTMGDGYVMEQYNGAVATEYYAACKYFAENGFELYSENKVGNALSSTYVEGDGYKVVMFNGNKSELYIGTGESGANAFPSEELDSFDEIAVTQHYSPEINGMCYFIKLSDGSFIVVDGGYKTDLEDAFKTLSRLNGSAFGIKIRAWIITHSHGDHYEMFDYFSRTYADKVEVERIMYSPVPEVGLPGYNPFLNASVNVVAGKFGAELCPVHTGMSFTFGDVTLEVLSSPEHIYKSNTPDDFNETSIVFRIRNEEGNMIFLGDSGCYNSEWLVATYGDALKSNMVQISHHGCETATIALYEKIAAETLFWPCNENLFNSYRGEEVKQYLIEAESSKEHLLHSYGSITRPLSYKPEIEYLDIMPENKNFIKGNDSWIENLRLEDGTIKYEVKGNSEDEGFDPYITINYRKLDIKTDEYNAIRIVIGAGDANGGALYVSTHDDASDKFSSEKHEFISEQGKSDDDTTTLIVYLGDNAKYSESSGQFKGLRLDLGAEEGQTVEIYSIEMFKLNVD